MKIFEFEKMRKFWFLQCKKSTPHCCRDPPSAKSCINYCLSNCTQLSLAPARIFWGIEVHRRRAVGGIAVEGARGGSPSGAGEVFKNILKIHENVQFLGNNFLIFDNFNRKFIFSNFSRIFRENLGKNLEKFRNMHLYGVRGRSHRS